MPAGTLFHELKSTGNLPSPTGVALEIMQLAQRADVTVQTLAKVIQIDPALSGRLLKFVNSPYIGVHRPVVAITDAVIILGISVVRQFALSVSIVSNTRIGGCAEFDYSTFWSNALARAVAIQYLAARDRVVAPEEAFTCGLLSEVGRLALASVYPEAYSACLAACSEDDEPGLLKCEQQRFATDHVELSLAMIGDWKLPAVFIDAVANHRQPDAGNLDKETRAYRFACQLQLARVVGRYCVAEGDRRLAMLMQLTPLAKANGFNEASLDEMLDQVGLQWREWGSLLDIPTKPVPATEELKPDHEESEIAEPPLPKLRILLVDDDPLQLMRISRQLVAEGHTVTTARSGEEGLKLALSEKPQLIVTDWRMAPVDGLQFCRSLRSTAFGRRIYVIILTSAETDDDLIQAFDAGADDYVVKPVSTRVLAARIRAGRRILQLQEELTREHQAIQRYASELMITNRRLDQATKTDMRTELPNRRYAFSRIEQEWATALRTGRPLSLLVLDLDHFKQINDLHGHDVGDQVLIHAARLIRSSVRLSDIACRVGGEEFIVIAPNSDLNAARQLGERIRLTIQQTQPAGISTPKPLTVSIGVAMSTPKMTHWQDLIKRADKALYKVKQSGRNGVATMLDVQDDA
jgi:two-component system cell cycle response regulator